MEAATEQLLRITDVAAAKVKEFMQREGKLDSALRLYVTGGGCAGFSYGLSLEDETSEDDIVMHQNGIKVVVDSFSAKYVKGSVIDYVDSLQGSGFKVDNPNITSTCACGHSFQTGGHSH